MQLIFERSIPGLKTDLVGTSDVPFTADAPLREEPLRLPELTEGEVSRHYRALVEETFGVNCGFYPLGSCTMKYNPKLNEAMAALPGFTQMHPLAPEEDADGTKEMFALTEHILAEVTGMDRITFQPAAGAHGEWTGLLLMKRYHEARGEGDKRKKMLVPETAHGTNPASAVMTGYDVVTLRTNDAGDVDLESLKAALSDEVAGLMLTNPSTLGLFERDILEITRLVHEAGGLVYYDGANLNAIMGHVRPGDMGFDCVHLNLHKTFSTPHGGGGPGSGVVGCKDFLAPYLPTPVLERDDEDFLYWDYDRPESIGRVKAFYGHSAMIVRTLTYLLSLGGDGLRAASSQAVLSANYMRVKLKESYPAFFDRLCMHEFTATMAPLKKETGVSAADLAKGMLDGGMHPPTMYFPLNVPEALMFEPTETESLRTLDEAIDFLDNLVQKAHDDAEALHQAPTTTRIGRVDEVQAARKPITRYTFPEEA